ncbi:MAG: S9 family peptidase [Chloroflexi bacterium]|nr:S9 family peptidase [Chloroflexota bacterium]
MKTRAMYGTWSSSVSSALVSTTAKLNDAMWAGETIVWHETRGAQHYVVSQSGSNAPRIISGDKASTGKIAYGGGMFGIRGYTVAFAGTGGRLYTVPASGGSIRPITPGFGGVGGIAISPDGDDVVFGHTYEDKDGLAIVDMGGQDFPRKLYYPSDFIMNPVWHPDGWHLAVMVWDHPNMPWDGCEIHMLTLNDRREVVSVEVLAGGREISVMQPTFSPDGRYLAYISDESGWWHIYFRDLISGEVRQITHGEAEYGGPQWGSGMRYFAFTPDSRAIVARRSEKVQHSLWRIDLESGGATPLLTALPYTFFAQISINLEGRVAVIASAPRIPHELISFDPDFSDVVIHARTVDGVFAPEVLSEPEHIVFTTRDNADSHGLFYPPTSTQFESSGLPPVIVFQHGGPTSANYLCFEPVLQFWATRGYAVFAVNFRGGTGYGRANMLKLNGRWGDIDLADSVDGVKSLATQGRIDPAKAVIYGGSSGGYAVLQGLCEYPGTFKAGVCLYGISDMFALAKETHKFEAHYNDSLLGPLPDAAALYRKRSPLFHNEKIRDALIVFQGADDIVVPQNQSDMMVNALRARGVPVEYHIYAGEGHGFRKPETVDHYLKHTLAFLERTVIYI